MMKNTSMSKHGSTVTIDCFPDEDNTSCVSMYRAYDNSTVKHIDIFPAAVTLVQPGDYTFALFKRIGNASIDERPFITRVFTVENDEPTSTLPGKFMYYILCCSFVAYPSNTKSNSDIQKTDIVAI